MSNIIKTVSKLIAVKESDGYGARDMEVSYIKKFIKMFDKIVDDLIKEGAATELEHARIQPWTEGPVNIKYILRRGIPIGTATADTIIKRYGFIQDPDAHPTTVYLNNKLGLKLYCRIERGTRDDFTSLVLTLYLLDNVQ